MLRQKTKILSILKFFIDICLTVASFFLAYLLRAVIPVGYFGGMNPLINYLWLLIVIIPLWSMLIGLLGVPNTFRTQKMWKELSRIALASSIGTLLIMAVIFILKAHYISRPFIVIFGILNFIILSTGKIILRILAHYSVTIDTNQRAVIVAGEGDATLKIAEILASHAEWGLRVMGLAADDLEKDKIEGRGYRMLGHITDIPDIILTTVIDDIIFIGGKNTFEKFENIFLACEEQGIRAWVTLDIFPHSIATVSVDEIHGIPLLGFSTVPHNELSLIMKRVFDVVLSFCAFVLLSPLMAAVAVAIKITSAGPILFSQVRCGLNGRKFLFYKFRTMIDGADEMKVVLQSQNEVDGPVFKIKNDPRVTAIGRLLRRSSLDELPQLWNILIGDMSVVGPRPPLPSEVVKYERWQRRRLSMKPGLTCIWQVSGRSDVGFSDWMKMDLDYIDNWSWKLDLSILMKTIPAVLLGKGAH